MNKDREANALLIISGLRKIIAIFLGPFLTAYFIKESSEYLVDIAVYRSLCYLFLGLGGIVIGYIIKDKINVNIFRTGVVCYFIYILFIIVLREKILDYLPVMGLLYGVSSILYHYPFNLYSSEKVSNSYRGEYEFKKKTLSMIIGTVVPFFLGSIISTTNFIITAIIILFICLLQFILSFRITPMNNRDKHFTPFSSIKNFMKDESVRAIIKADFYRGMNVGDGALEILTTVLIFNAFKTDMNLGIVTSLSGLFIIIMQYFYTKRYKNRSDKSLIIYSSILPVICLILLLLYKNNLILIIYYFVYTVLLNILVLIQDVRLYNISNSKLVKKTDRMEFWSIREAFLNLGRITSYILLLIFSLLSSYLSLNYLLILLSLTIILMGYNLSKVTKNEKINRVG